MINFMKQFMRHIKNKPARNKCIFFTRGFSSLILRKLLKQYTKYKSSWCYREMFNKYVEVDKIKSTSYSKHYLMLNLVTIVPFKSFIGAKTTHGEYNYFIMNI